MEETGNSEYRRKQVSASSSGSGAASQQHPHQDLMDKLSFLSDKSSNRRGKSFVGVNDIKNWNGLDKVLAQKQEAGIIVSEPNRFHRIKKINSNDVVRNELTAMSSAIQFCAEKFSEKLMKSEQKLNTAEPYEKQILKYFERIHEEERKDTMMKEMLAVIIEFPQKPQQ